MLKYLRQQGEKGQIAVLLALAMIGLLAIVGLALDGGMLYWNQRRAQNGADAAVIAGVTVLANYTELGEACDTIGSENAILTMVHTYADVNDVPDADAGENVKAFYLIENSDGDRVDLMSGGDPWQVGLTGTVPCEEDPVGLRVEASFPQQTFLAGVIGIAETNVTVEASALVDSRAGCGDFVILSLSHEDNLNVLSITGAGTTIGGAGIHSNGGMHLGGGGQDISLATGEGVEYGEDVGTQISEGQIVCNQIGDDGMPEPVACGDDDPPIGTADSVGLGDTFYRFEDFDEGGFIWEEVDAVNPSMTYKINGDLNVSDVEDADGSLINGLYVVTGDVQLNGLQDTYEQPWRVTIAAQGEIFIAGGFSARPYARGVLFFTESDNTAQGAIHMSGSNNTWAGLIVAPNGLITTSGSQNNDLSGMIIGYEVSLSGSSNTIRHHPNLCPPDPPKVLLIQ